MLRAQALLGFLERNPLSALALLTTAKNSGEGLGPFEAIEDALVAVRVAAFQPTVPLRHH